MHIDTQAKDLGGGAENVRLLEIPDTCPRCHRAVHAKVIEPVFLRERDLAQVVFRCTHQKCQELFLGTYDARAVNASRRMCVFLHVAPISVQPAVFPETVATLSPTFVTIFDQAMAAEVAQLDQLVGIGLRKALEFLIKDYAVCDNPASEAHIRKLLLVNCIDQYVADPNVKECAKRAAWLGNDETHYTRRWEAKDVQDLKRLVRLTVNWIDNVLTTKKYIAEMSASNPSPAGATPA